MAVKRFRNIPRQWEKRVMGKGSPHYAKYKTLYPGQGSRENLSKSELERSIRNLSTQAKISLLQPELAKAKKEVSEQSLLGPALGGDMDSLPDDPWFSKSPEEKHADVIQEEHGQYEDGVWVSEDEGEDKLLNKLAREEFAEKEFLKSDDDLGFAENEKDISRFLGPQYQPSTDSRGPAWRTESDENALDILARTEPERLKAERAKEISLADFKGEEEGSGWDKFKGLFA